MKFSPFRDDPWVASYSQKLNSDFDWEWRIKFEQLNWSTRTFAFLHSYIQILKKFSLTMVMISYASRPGESAFRIRMVLTKLHPKICVIITTNLINATRTAVTWSMISRWNDYNQKPTLCLVDPHSCSAAPKSDLNFVSNAQPASRPHFSGIKARKNAIIPLMIDSSNLTKPLINNFICLAFQFLKLLKPLSNIW